MNNEDAEYIKEKLRSSLDSDTLNYIQQLEEQRDEYHGLFIVGMETRISKDKIQNKIDELNKEKGKYDNEFRLYTLRDTFEFQIKILKELLKASEENARTND